MCDLCKNFSEERMEADDKQADIEFWKSRERFLNGGVVLVDEKYKVKKGSWNQEEYLKELNKKMNIKPYYNSSISHITQPFGVNPTPYHPNGHTGVDFAFPLCYGTNLVAPEDVVIKMVIDQKTFDPVKYLENLSKGFGVLMTSVKNPDIDYLFWHCINPIPVKIGQIVKQGELIAQMGNSGFVMVGGNIVPIELRNAPGMPGSHLHYEKRVNNVYANPIPNIDFSIPVPLTKIEWMISILKIMSNLLLDIR